ATTPTTTDNCSGTITGTTSDPLTYTTQGTHIITWNFDDGNGNSIDVTQNVIVDDITNPNPDEISLADVLEVCELTSLTAPFATDNCSGSITGTTTTVFPITEQDTTIVTWVFDDGNGNITTQEQLVILTDDVVPTVITQDIDVYLDVNGFASISYLDIDNGTYDNCLLVSMALDITEFTIDDIGVNTVVLYAYDYAGNTGVNTASVTVIDPTININSLNDASIVIYPNPSSGIFNIESEILSTIVITDVTGRVILTTDLINKNTEIDLSNYGNGVYFISFILDNKTTTRKIIIQ
ncbi:MAG: T9SS type A sorting domain-containing protein, partial [Bacteroidales bacterium]|nr:T9SS type A sorting domain-containing protein [Bacteroidales bacterium]